MAYVFKIRGPRLILFVSRWQLNLDDTDIPLTPQLFLC
jgi:hypothetical protein